MANNPTLTLKDIRRKLKKLGYKKVRSVKHEIWDKDGNIVPISQSKQDVGHRLLTSICHQLGMTKKEFFDI
jgi:predicted RNA binding protein YcfA (HicA-like mRNA interferase family)